MWQDLVTISRVQLGITGKYISKLFKRYKKNQFTAHFKLSIRSRARKRLKMRPVQDSNTSLPDLCVYAYKLYAKIDFKRALVFS